MLDFFSFFVFSLLGIRDFISMEMKERDKIPDPMNREDTKKMKSNKFSTNNPNISLVKISSHYLVSDECQAISFTYFC